MNNSYYETLDENFKQALNLYEGNYSHQQLIKFLENGNIVQRQIAALRLETLESVQDAQILLQNLTGQDGKIREAVSLKINEFSSVSGLANLFNPSLNYEIFLDAIVDINANICRNIIGAIINFKDDTQFCSVFSSSLIKRTKNILEVVEKFDFQQGKYKVNKEVFKLYWCLEAIYEFSDKISIDDLKEIIIRAKDIQDYTIREKCAKILSKNFTDSDLVKIQIELKNDSNYYVRRY